MLLGFGFGGIRLNFGGRGRLYARSCSDTNFFHGEVTYSSLFDDVRLKTFPKIGSPLIFVQKLCSRTVRQLVRAPLNFPALLQQCVRAWP